MKMYCLFYRENSHSGNLATVDLYLDLTDIQAEGGPTEEELRQAALAGETGKPGWRVIL